MIHFMESISQRITAASPARSGWMSFWGMICLARSTHAFPVYCTYTCQFIIFALGKIFISGLHWVSWGSELPLMQMTAAVFLTLCTVDRLGNSKDLSGSTAELTAPTAAAINISGSNNHGCLFFPKLSVSMTGLFWRWLLFWHISGPTVTAPCLCSVCTLTLNLPPVPWRGWHAASAHSVQRKPHWHQSSVSLFYFSRFSRFSYVLAFNGDKQIN